MWSVTPAWLAALGTPHGRYSRVEAWYNGAKVTTFQPESGSVQVTARNRIRRTLTATFPESFWPATATAVLAPYGTQLKVFQGITGTNGVLIGSEVPVFTGRVEKVARERLSGKITVQGSDPFADINDSQFEQPRTATVGGSVVGQIASLITDVWPTAGFVDQTGSTAVVPTATTWNTDRGQAIDDLAGSIGAEVFVLPDGVTWVIRPVPQIGNAPVWTLKEGQGGTLVRDSQSKARTDVANRIVVHVEQPGGTPLMVTVTDATLQSATRYGGPYGRVVRHYSNALIAAADQAVIAGTARLARSIGATRTRDLDTVPNPALEAGDVITAQTADGTERHIADAFSVPLAVADVMTINTRSTQTSGS